MARGQNQYTDEFKNTIAELYNSGKSLAELSSEYALSKSTITGWLKKNARFEEENDILKKAIKLQRPTKPLVLHSDLGCQYTSSAFKEYIAGTKIIIHSFSGKGCPYDNACIDSFHSSLKKEEVYTVKYFDYDAARLAIFEYIESWYN